MEAGAAVRVEHVEGAEVALGEADEGASDGSIVPPTLALGDGDGDGDADAVAADDGDAAADPSRVVAEAAEQAQAVADALTAQVPAVLLPPPGQEAPA